MKKLFTQYVFNRNERIDEDVLKAELQSAQGQVEWSLRF